MITSRRYTTSSLRNLAATRSFSSLFFSTADSNAEKTVVPLNHYQDTASSSSSESVSVSKFTLNSELTQNNSSSSFLEQDSEVSPGPPRNRFTKLNPGSGSAGLSDFWKGGDFDPATTHAQRKETVRTGLAWPACLLRLKSFDDLHKLWFVCLREKNFLLSERHAYKQTHGSMFRNHGRLKKVKLTMKRILTVLSRREIHQQALRAKEILKLQSEREVHETRRFHLLEQNRMLRAKLDRLGNTSLDSVSRGAWLGVIAKNEEELSTTLTCVLKPLRRATTQLLIPDWRYSRKYTDLPGLKRWKKEWVRALDEHKRRPFRFY